VIFFVVDVFFCRTPLPFCLLLCIFFAKPVCSLSLSLCQKKPPKLNEFLKKREGKKKVFFSFSTLLDHN